MMQTSELTPPCCIVYTTDREYLFPTLVSAIQARRHASPAKADVILFCVDLDEEARRVFAPVCRRERVGLESVDSRVIEGQTAMLARLFLNRFIRPEYTQFLYLDGDVHILESLDPLLEAEVPPGRFLAVNDPMTFLLADDGPQSRDLMRHIRSIGLTEQQALRYFNSGVLRINRHGWEETGLEAFQYFQSAGGHSRFPDQDALNVVGVDRRMPLSLTWNYPVFMRNSRVESAIRPRIKHFMSSPKPWHGAFPPWTGKSCVPYLDTLRAYPALVPFHRTMKWRARATYHLQQRGKRCLETVTWGFSQRRERILRYEAACFASSIGPVSLMG